jgi:DNA ligase 1
MKKWPVLYGKSSTGKIKTWKIWVQENSNETATILTEYGYEDGEVQCATVTVMNGKNIGRANATTPYEQACSEAESKWKKKQDKKYAETKKGLEGDSNPLPMLAVDFKKRGHSIEWPAFIQPKLNGIRCLARKLSPYYVDYLSRGGKTFDTLSHLTPHLLRTMKEGEVLDGELFTRELTFQEITSAVKKQQEITTLVEYWIYDMVRDEPFADRLKLLKSYKFRSPLVLVPTISVKNETQMKKLHQQMVEAEYEGTIIRNMAGTYRIDHRSPDLQKYKDFIDQEFEIVGGKEGVGKDAGAVTFICQVTEGKTFDCRPRGTYEQRQQWWRELPDLLGKQLTVRYQELTDDGKPRFPVGIAIRDYE